MSINSTYHDNQLTHRLASGDEQAFREIFEMYWDHIHAVGLKVLKSPELAKDLAQDSFMKLWHNREQLHDVRNLGAYLNVLSRNLAIDQLRKKVFTTENEDYLLDYFSVESAMPSNEAEFKDLEKLLHDAVDHLPPQMQQVFRLSRFEGLSHAEIANRMHIAPVTSKSYMVRALAAIRRYLAQYQYDPLLIWVLFFSLL